MITAVIFDLDDTLYDEIDYCRSGFQTVAEYVAGLPETPSADKIFAALWRQFSGGNRTRTFDLGLDELGIAFADSLVGELVKVYREHAPSITLPEESREVLDELKTRYELALLTDGFLPAQELKVRALGIEGYFASIIYTEQLGREFWKPSPVGFRKVMNDLGAEPENIVYVADNETKDFIAPNNLGISTIRLIRPAGIHKTVVQGSGGKAQHEIRQIRQLPPLLELL